MPTSFRSPFAFVLIGYIFVCAGACGGDPKETCTTLPADCKPGIDPTYTQIYSQIFTKSCAGNACHGAMGTQGGLGLFNADTAYDQLLGKTDGRMRVEPGNPACSILMERLNSDDESFRMPYRGTKLEPGLLCAVQKWIESGAAK